MSNDLRIVSHDLRARAANGSSSDAGLSSSASVSGLIPLIAGMSSGLGRWSITIKHQLDTLFLKKLNHTMLGRIQHWWSFTDTSFQFFVSDFFTFNSSSILHQFSSCFSQFSQYSWAWSGIHGMSSSGISVPVVNIDFSFHLDQSIIPQIIFQNRLAIGLGVHLLEGDRKCAYRVKSAQFVHFVVIRYVELRTQLLT